MMTHQQYRDEFDQCAAHAEQRIKSIKTASSKGDFDKVLSECSNLGAWVRSLRYYAEGLYFTRSSDERGDSEE
jgi:hypothetical protein